MAWKQQFFSFSGRVNRKAYWLRALLSGAMLGFFMGLGIGFGRHWPPAFLISGFLLVPFTWISWSLGIRRLHDRDKSAWWVIPFFLLPGLLIGIAHHAGGPAKALYLVSLGIMIWRFVELGCLRGAAGTNRYGPDPLSQASGAV